MNPEQIIRQVCEKANPSRFYGADYTIRLADVLLASNEKYQTSASLKWSGIISCWNLRAGCLSLQSDETKQFLADLLTK